MKFSLSALCRILGFGGTPVDNVPRDVQDHLQYGLLTFRELFSSHEMDGGALSQWQKRSAAPLHPELFTLNRQDGLHIKFVTDINGAPQAIDYISGDKAKLLAGQWPSPHDPTDPNASMQKFRF